MRCEVKGECLGYALAHHPLSGIWGGTSELQRQMIHRETRADSC